VALTPERARDLLREVAVDEVAKRQARRGLLLLGGAATAFAMLRDDASRRGDAEAARLLDDLSDGARRRTFTALHPGLGEVIALAWNDLRTDPYPVGFTRRAFRAPGNPEVSRPARVRWLRSLLSLARYEQSLSWFAEWAGRLDYAQGELGRLFGVAIDHGDDEVFDLLRRTILGEHEVAMLGRHVPIALLSCARPEAWELAERLLVAAQRQEGLRQSILEAVDLAHPVAFRRMVRLVVEQGMTRFASVIRAVGVWFGEPFEVTDRALVDTLLLDLLGLLDSESERDAALAGPDPGRVYLALWATAFEDAMSARRLATELLDHDSADHRLAAARLLVALRLPAPRDELVGALGDDDLRVAAVAVEGFPDQDAFDLNAFAGLRRLLDRLGRASTTEVGLWKAQRLPLDRARVADRLATWANEHTMAALAEVVPAMSAAGRYWYVLALAKKPDRYRQALLDLVGDRSESVRDQALKALSTGPAPSEAQARELEKLMRRRSGDLRRGVLTLLLRQKNSAARESARRLLDGNPAQVEAGRELRAELSGTKAGQESADQPPVDRDEVIDHGSRTPVAAPAGDLTMVRRMDDGVARVLTSLDAWVAEHRDVEVKVDSWQGPTVVLLADITWLTSPSTAVPWESQRAQFPLRELAWPWWERTRPQLKEDGLEVAFAVIALKAAREARAAEAKDRPRWLRSIVDSLAQPVLARELRYEPLIGGLLDWLVANEAEREWVDPLLDAAEAVLASVPQAAIRKLPRIAQLMGGQPHAVSDPDWRSQVDGFCELAITVEALRPELWTAAQRGRLVRLGRFVDEPRGARDPRALGRETATFGFNGTAEYPRRPARRRLPIRLLARAIDDGVATRADMLDLLMGERTHADRSFLFGHSPLGDLTRRRRPDWLDAHPWISPMVDEVRALVIDAETARGELPTPFSDLVRDLRGVEGADTVVRLLSALGNQKLDRNASGTGKAAVLSQLIRLCFPRTTDTAEDLTSAVSAHRLSERRLRELAVYAPQWATIVETATGQAGLTSAVHWLHAHTKDDRWQVDEDVREEWAARTQEHTPLAAEDLLDGAVDVDWLASVRETVGDDGFDELVKVAKYTSSGGGHARAVLFANAVRGKVDRSDLLGRIQDKRQQDAVRALGLLPLPTDAGERVAELSWRYELLRDWLRQGSRFGAQRRASEKLAVRIGTENLARAAGYRDPQRFMWAMEAEAVRDLATGPVQVVDGETVVSLGIDQRGAPQLEVRKGDRELRAVPRSLAKDKRVVALKKRVTELRQQGQRMRAALEQAAVTGDRFTADELAELTAHPMLAPLLGDLVLVSEEGLIGFPRDGGRRLLGHDGVTRDSDGSPMRIAHPHDLLASEHWPAWQRACFESRVRQPFKQVFRELYVLTESERGGATTCERFAGHQVNPRQAVALLGARGWVSSRVEGALRTFHAERLTARLDILGDTFTPADVGGMAIENLVFTPAGEWQPVPLESVPPRLFSETMRDLDLVVSVAHIGGVDPEASTSTVRMRGALVRETAELLGLDNVEVTDHHVLITGKLGSYSVHLGSAVVHRRPGNALCIVPVSDQHRGRLFLPFVDDDPRTAEVVSKVALLARDDKIKDPTILEQLRA
jgi:Family of unknown function (DUF5724)/Domain of unknown function (DUF4132)